MEREKLLESSTMLLRECIRLLVVEGIVDDVKKKYEDEMASIDIIDRLSKNDPSGKNKYLRWMAKQMFGNKSSEHQLYMLTKAFHDRPDAFSSKDINSYKDIEDLRKEALKISPTKNSIKQKTKQRGAPLITTIGNFSVYRIDTRQACIMYGSGTKWCISMAHKDSHWRDHSKSSVLYLVVDRSNGRKIIVELPILFVDKTFDGKSTKKTNFKVYDEVDDGHDTISDALNAPLNDEGRESTINPDIENEIVNAIKKDAPNSPWYKMTAGMMSPEEKKTFQAIEPTAD